MGLVAATLAVDLVVTLARPAARHPAAIKGGATGGASPAPTSQLSPDGAQLAVAGLDPSACRAFRPTAPANGRTVFLDPGHGGPDPGGSGQLGDGTPVLEKAATLAVAADLSALLRGAGYRVVLSRTADTAVTQLTDADLDGGSMRGSALHRDLLARIACANASRADVLLAIHFNAFDDPTAGGAVTLYDPSRPFAVRSRSLADALQSAVVSQLQVDDRGVTSDEDISVSTITDAGAAYGHLIELGPPEAGWVDTPSAMPGALVEPLFLTAPDEAVLAARADGQAKIARALADGLGGYFSRS
ncbi:MAG TPA: N-acetylmuramoyl-L-alanine amidase [Candidatus Dormibacteraeota bacterium]